MGRLIDADVAYYAYKPKNCSDEQWNLTTLAKCILNAPTVDAIPKAEVKKFLEEGTKNVSNDVLAIVREDYIHKAEYEARLKADMVAMLTEIQLEIEELDPNGDEWSDSLDACNDIIQQKINALKG